MRLTVSLHALSVQNLRAVFGFNKDIQAGVHDLTDVNRQAVLCVSAHTGIIYDYENRTQLLLQGHCNAISATCVSADKKFIVTADSAPSPVRAADAANACS